MSDSHYETVDLPFYRGEIAPVLPPRVLDFHTHVWTKANWKETPWATDAAGGKYMVTNEEYPPEKMLADGRTCFPDREYHAVCFGYPTPAVDWAKDTAYVAAAARQHAGLYPLVLGGCELGLSREQYEQALGQGGFYGFKVFLNWYGDNYGDKRVEEMLGPVEMSLANERRLIVLLHVPRRGRLADPIVQAGVERLAKDWPQAQIVLAHCGRCYVPAEMKQALPLLRRVPSLYLDSSMVMDPVVLQMVIDTVSPEHLLYATDFPVAAMRGRRVRVMDHWVDVTLAGYPESAFRVQSAGIHATFMAWEIALAVRWAAELTKIGDARLRDIFWGNGRTLLQRVLRGG